METRKIGIQESQIEDILSTYPDILKDILGISEDLTLIARQKILLSGNKIDLLFIVGKTILLVELKVEAFKKEFFIQVRDYGIELMQLQRDEKLVDGDIFLYLLCIDFRDRDRNFCEEQGVFLVKYSPEFVLENFFARLKNLANFISLKPTNHGLWNIHLLNKLLYVLDNPKPADSLANVAGLSKSTVRSYLKLAQELLLVNNTGRKWALTENGKKFLLGRDYKASVEFISNEQSKILQNVIIQNPFASGAILGIYIIVEALFNLSKNTYPVPENLLIEYFKEGSGRYYEWTSRKTAFDSMKMYSNYAIDLGLMGKIGNKFYITPDGIHFILLLNLHKTIKIVDALGISKTYEE